nr:hypothetical protein CFP56_74129 [Quercus suber]
MSSACSRSDWALNGKIEEEKVIGTAARDDDFDGRALSLLPGAEEEGRGHGCRYQESDGAGLRSITNIYILTTDPRSYSEHTTQATGTGAAARYERRTPSYCASARWFAVQHCERAGRPQLRALYQDYTIPQCSNGRCDDRGAPERSGHRGTGARFILQLLPFTMVNFISANCLRMNVVGTTGGFEQHVTSAVAIRLSGHGLRGSFLETYITHYKAAYNSPSESDQNYGSLLLGKSAFLGDSAHPDANLPPDENRSRVRPDSLLIAVRIRHSDLILT